MGVGVVDGGRDFDYIGAKSPSLSGCAKSTIDLSANTTHSTSLTTTTTTTTTTTNLPQGENG